MIEHLKEFRDLADMASGYRPGRGIPEPPDEEAITRCIQVMMARQCIYPGMHAIGPSYRILSTPEYQGFFRRYFAAMGLEFHHDTRSGMVALRVPGNAPRFDRQRGRLKKDETAVLLTLRVAYEEAFKAKQFSDIGVVETTTDEIFDKLAVIGSIEIERTRLMDILGFLKRKGVVEIGERDPVDGVSPLTILPGIEVVVPQEYVERVRMIAEGIPPADGSDGTGGASLADVEAGIGGLEAVGSESRKDDGYSDELGIDADEENV